MAKDTLSMLGEKVEVEADPRELLKEIFRFINLRPANIDIYFLLLDNKRPMTVKEICNSLHYSERTVRKYLKELLKLGYIKRNSTVRDRPCYSYLSVSPKDVWGKLVEEVRAIRIKAGRSISKFKQPKFHSF